MLSYVRFLVFQRDLLSMWTCRKEQGWDLDPQHKLAARIDFTILLHVRSVPGGRATGWSYVQHDFQKLAHEAQKSWCGCDEA